MLLFFIVFTATTISASSVRIKDIASYQNDAETDLIGYGLIIGLDGTGDGKGTQFTIQSLVNMMERMGVTVNAAQVKVKNVAAVMVTAKISSAHKPGSRIDVTVSSVGDASSLQGGTLLLTPLSSLDGTVYAVAQGAVSIGGFNVQLEDGNKIVNNYTLVGRVPDGALVQTQPTEIGDSKDIYMSLLNPDYTTASRIVNRINREYGLTAYAIDEGAVRIRVPDSLSHPNDRIDFISTIGRLRVSPDAVAKVVINEKTGTIVAGQNVSISPVALAHGNLTINIRSTPVISQPGPFSDGETVVTSESQLSVTEDKARVIQLPEVVTISQVAMALNSMGATPRDIIAILQALKETGALRAQLVLL
ncbi:MAG: flagellar basal body P-ring protein FlgI [FCB group bacterium]|nr:flagellar basal body P-ring protein FlgI [FCB group bacterium]